MDKSVLKEFQLFAQSNEMPPQAISKGILARVDKELHPSDLKVFSKLGGIQILLGLVTLVFCPQLGVGPLIGGHGIMMWFMHYGPVACAGLCGALFLGSSVLLASLFLKPEELRGLKNRHLVGLPILSAVSLVILMLLGGSGSLVIYAAWLLGAIIASEVSSHAVYSLRIGRLAA